MLLVADVGNTNTKIGVFEGQRLLVSWRLTSRREQTADEYGLFIETLLHSRGIRAAAIQGVAISNVVPPVQQTLEWMCEKYFSRPPYFVEPGLNTRMPLAVDAPREVGADRYVDAFAAAAKYGAPLIVIDFGTATTFNCVNGQGEFIGGAIAPGIVTSVPGRARQAQGGDRAQHDLQSSVRRDLRLCRPGGGFGRAHASRAGGRGEGHRDRGQRRPPRGRRPVHRAGRRKPEARGSQDALRRGSSALARALTGSRLVVILYEI
jgi:pantothenate kinase type III